MSPLAAGLGLALGSSLALNGSYLVQHAGVARAPAVSARHPLRTVRGLLRSPVWVAGLALGLCGWALYVAALARAPLSLVQAFSAGGLVLLAPVAVRALRHRLDHRERWALGSMAAALVVLSLGAREAAPGAGLGPAALLAYLAGTGALALVLVLRAQVGRTGEVLGLAGGLLYGAADVATKALTAVGHGGGLAALARSPLLPVAAAATLGAFFCFQRGLQAGRALPVTALMTAGTNLISFAGGPLVFGDPLGATPLAAATHVLALAVVGLAAWALAPIQARLTAEADEPPIAGEDASIALRGPAPGARPQRIGRSTGARTPRRLAARGRVDRAVPPRTP